MRQKRLEIIALCNYADYSKDGKFNIVGIFDEIYSPKFPSSLVRGFLALTITGFEPRENAVFTVVITSPDKKKILRKEFTVITGENGKGNFALELVGFPLPISGDYEVSVLHLNKELGSTLFKALKVNNDSAKQGEKN